MTVTVKVGQSVIIIAIIIVLGYFLILVSVVTQPSESSFQNALIAKLDSDVRMLRKQVAATDLELRKAQTVIIANKKENVAEEAIKLRRIAASVRPGVIILGMHRSGTSIVGGLVNRMGLKTGGPLIMPAKDNEKGFFERIDVVLQNDELMKKQRVHYAFGTHRYDARLGIRDALVGMGTKFFNEGNRGLKFLNDRLNYPWMLKDPRLCITLRTWLPLLEFVPAILFTYRHPLDVALSMHKRETEQFTIQKGLKMWYVYNRRAVGQSNDLCRVTASHRNIMTYPQVEFDRIYEELHACGVPVPHKLSSEDISSFIDVKLQHGKTTLQDKTCDKDVDINKILPPTTWSTTEPNHIALYRHAMAAYCALEDGTAFNGAFQWNQAIIDE